MMGTQNSELNFQPRMQGRKLAPQSGASSSKLFKNCFLYFYIFIFLYLYIFILPFSCAQETSPTAQIKPSETKEITPTPKNKQSQLEKIRQLKERVATKVAELRKKSKKAYYGEIKEIADSTIVLITKKEEVRVAIDDETSIFRVTGGKKRKIALKDLDEGEKILALGVSNEQELPAKVIIVKALPLIINGKVIQVDTKAGRIMVKTSKENEFLVDYEKSTECKIYEKPEGLKKGGLSQIKVNDRVHVTATEGKEENLITALRILVLPGKALGIVGKEEITPTTALTPTPEE